LQKSNDVSIEQQPYFVPSGGNKVDCSKVVVRGSAYGDGAYAACDIKANEIVEYGIVRCLTNIDGNENPFIFTWSEDRTIWALGSGAATFYNTAEVANTVMYRYFDEERFVIVALRDIAAGEECTHVYKSKRWRKCFSDLNPENA
jgi:hypothetical protein